MDEQRKIKMGLSINEQVILFVNFIRSINFTNELIEDNNNKKLIQKLWDKFYSPAFEALVLTNIDVVILLKIWGLDVDKNDEFIKNILKTIFNTKEDKKLNTILRYAENEMRMRMSETIDPCIDLLGDLMLEFDYSPVAVAKLLDETYTEDLTQFERNVKSFMKKIFKQSS